VTGGLSLRCKLSLQTFQEKINHWGKKGEKSGIQPCQNQHIDRASAPAVVSVLFKYKGQKKDNSYFVKIVTNFLYHR
jgi:hypothetical protein